jgi:hypothetical protein
MLTNFRRLLLLPQSIKKSFKCDSKLSESVSLEADTSPISRQALEGHGGKP